jgi:predicted permease
MSAIADCIVPIFAIIALGAFLKRLGMTDGTFLALADRLLYYIFFPALLFWKTGKPAQGTVVEWKFIYGVLLSVFVIFVLSHLYMRLAKVPRYKVGSFSQACYRFNTYIGIAAIMTAFNEEGVRHFGALIGFVIPFINVLAVSTLIWFSGFEYAWRYKAVLLAKAMISNPLIIACLSGLAYSTLNTPLPAFLDNTFGLLAPLTLPLALISIGGSLTFAKCKDNLKYSLLAAVFKLCLLPAVGLVVLSICQVSGLPFKVAMLYFALPTSPANYILSGQLNSDVDLATASIVLSTMLSIVSLSLMLIVLGA